MSRPLFIFGVARSGTDLISSILNSHEKVVVALDPLMPFFKSLRNIHVEGSSDDELKNQIKPDMPFQDGYFESYGYKLIDLIMNGKLDLPIKNKNTLLKDIKDRTSLEMPDLANKINSVQGNTYKQLLENILDLIAESKKDTLWHGIKEVWTTDYIPLLARSFPDSKFIVNRRDPRAIIASLLEMMRKDPSQSAHVISYIRHWRKEAALLHMLKNDQLLDGRLYINYYESLVSKPECIINELCVFLNIEIKDEDKINRKNAYEKIGSNSSFDSESGISQSSVDRWENYLKPELLKTIEYLCAPEMLNDNYEIKNSLPIKIDEDITRQIKHESTRPGSWRSDSGNDEYEIANEEMRWNILQNYDKENDKDEIIRSHFLFKPFFNNLKKYFTQLEYQVS